MDPVINPHMTRTDRLTSLSKYPHAASGLCTSTKIIRLVSLIHYPHCKGTIWKYNAAEHIVTDNSDISMDSLDKQFLVGIQFPEARGTMDEGTSWACGCLSKEPPILISFGRRTLFIRRITAEESSVWVARRTVSQMKLLRSSIAR